MTPARLARFLFAGSVLLITWNHPLFAGDHFGKPKKKEPRPTWTKTIEGVPDKDPQVAQDTALIKAQSALEEYLQNQTPRLHRVPTKEFILSHLVTDQKTQPTKDGHEVVTYRLTVDDEKYRDIMREEARLNKEERDIRARTRMLGLAKFAGIVIAFLAALSGYLRLEEATKGYYTAWLRLAAISFVGAVGVGMWLIC